MKGQILLFYMKIMQIEAINHRELENNKFFAMIKSRN